MHARYHPQLPAIAGAEDTAGAGGSRTPTAQRTTEYDDITEPYLDQWPATRQDYWQEFQGMLQRGWSPAPRLFREQIDRTITMGRALRLEDSLQLCDDLQVQPERWGAYGEL